MLAAASLASTGIAATGAHRSADALPGYAATAADPALGGGQKCRVDIVRTGASGTSAISRTELPDGDCVCTIVTGAASSNGAAENAVNALLRDRECRDAPLNRQSARSGGAGGSGAVIGGILGAVAIGGLAVGIGGSDSPG
ncbi:MAG: hypothetical protein ACREBO_00110 [Novosphingobium sp.]